MNSFCHRCGAVLSHGNHFQFERKSLCRDCLYAVDPNSPQLDSQRGAFGVQASLERRFFAQMLDGLIAYAFLFVGSFIGALISDGEAVPTTLALLGFFGYFLLSDGLPNGQSLGKRALHIRVLDADTGKPCGFGRSFGRNITALVGLFDWVFIFGKSRQRLGDRLASTVVVSVGPKSPPAEKAQAGVPTADSAESESAEPAASPLPESVLPARPVMPSPQMPFSPATQSLAASFDAASPAGTMAFTAGEPADLQPGANPAVNNPP